jgi:hypothetical protein
MGESNSENSKSIPSIAEFGSGELASFDPLQSDFPMFTGELSIADEGSVAEQAPHSRRAQALDPDDIVDLSDVEDIKQVALARGSESDDDSSLMAAIVDIERLIDSGDSTNTFVSEEVRNAWANILGLIASKPGEKGVFTVDISGSMKKPGMVAAEVSGDAELDFAMSVSDENRVVLGIDAEVAIKLGLDILGLVHVGGEAGMGMSLIKMAFESHKDAATWMMQAFDELLSHLGPDSEGSESSEGSQGSEGKKGTELHDKHYDAGGYLDLTPSQSASVSVEGSETWDYREFINEKVDITQKTTDTNITVSSQFSNPTGKGGSGEFSWSYDDTNVTDSPFLYNNGPGKEHNFSIKFSSGDAWSNKKSTVSAETTKAYIDKALELITDLKDYIPVSECRELSFFLGKKTADTARLVSDAVTSKLQSDASKEGHASKFAIIVNFDLNSFGNSDGSFDIEYCRSSISFKAEQDFEGDIGELGHGKLMISATKTLRLQEWLGTETPSYMWKQYTFQSDDRPWSAFKEEHRDDLRGLVQNISEEDSPWHDNPTYQPVISVYEVAIAAGDSQEDAADKAIEKLESRWDWEEALVERMEPDAATLVELSNEETHHSFLWFKDNDHTKEMEAVLSQAPYSDDQLAMDSLMQLVADMGGNIGNIRSRFPDLDIPSALASYMGPTVGGEYDGEAPTSGHSPTTNDPS